MQAKPNMLFFNCRWINPTASDNQEKYLIFVKVEGKSYKFYDLEDKQYLALLNCIDFHIWQL
jgi:hypothetical protein